LVNCQGGNVASSNDCPNGCQSMPVGVPDACKAEAPPPSPCAGKDNASICAGDGVLLCVGGQVQQSITCTEGCVESGGAANCQQPPPPDPCNGTPSGPSCEGDVLRQCKDGKTASATPCAFGCGDLGGALGCLPDPATVDPCTDLADGGHCAAKGDDASVLRTCAAGKTIALQVCGFGCASVGGKDGCAQPGGGGACAATPDGTRCDGTKLLTCQGGAVVDQQLCAFGCAVFAGKAGCLSVEGAACADAGDGPACQGQLLLGCAAGQVQSATLCTEGCEASGGAHCSAASGFCADKVDAAWCSGGKLVHCLAQFEAGVEVCKYGCHPQPGATPDTCAAAKSSVCGGQTDGSYCDGPARVGCQGGLEVGRVACALGCGGVPGQASCEAAEAVACVGKDDGTHCIGSAVVACASGEAALVTPCVNGCAVDSAFGPSCVQASQTAAALGVAVDAAGCASLQGDFVLSTVAHQSQLGEDAQLGTCPDRTVQSHGAFVGALSMVYATLGAPRTVLGVSGNTPALENAWRTQHDGYGDCGAPGVCCPRWDRDPEPIGFDLSAPLPTCLPSQVVARIATSLVAGRPVVAEVRAPGGVGAGRFVALVGVDKVAGWLVLDSAATAEVRPLSSVLAGGAELARVALPRLDGEGLHDLDGKPIADGGVAPLVDADPVDGGGSTDVGDAGGAPEVFGDGGGLDLGTGAGIPRAEPSGCSAGRDRPVPTIAWLLLAALIVIGSRRRRRSA
jgi:MYXO-CTERM domain-containing protein